VANAESEEDGNDISFGGDAFLTVEVVVGLALKNTEMVVLSAAKRAG
jgi:hypothetical protein